MRNFKNILAGLTIAMITFLYWLFIMTFGDEFRRAHSEYRQEITSFFIISAILFNIILIYVFYNRIKIKDKVSLFLISSPFLLVLIIGWLFSQNLSRILDVVFIGLGSVLIYEITTSKIKSYKPIMILGAYLLIVSVSYPFLFSLIEKSVS